MNTAISVFRRLNEEFLSKFPQFDDHSEIIEYLYWGYYDPSHEKEDLEFATYNGTGFKLSSKIFFCANIYSILAAFYMSAEVPFFHQEAARQSGLHFAKDEEVLLKCLSLLALNNAYCNGKFFGDQLSEGLHIIQQDKKIYTWVVFAVQLLVDTRRVLGKELERCFTEAQDLRKWMSKTLQQTLDFGRTNNMNEYYKLNSKPIESTLEVVKEKLERDFIQDIADEYLGAHAALYPWGSFYLFRNHPMLLGLIVQNVLVKMQLLGIGLSDQGAVITSIHLYNAAQRSNQIPQSLGSYLFFSSF